MHPSKLCWWGESKLLFFLPTYPVVRALKQFPCERTTWCFVIDWKLVKEPEGSWRVGAYWPRRVRRQRALGLQTEVVYPGKFADQLQSSLILCLKFDSKITVWKYMVCSMQPWKWIERYFVICNPKKLTSRFLKSEVMGLRSSIIECYFIKMACLSSS